MRDERVAPHARTAATYPLVPLASAPRAEGTRGGGGLRVGPHPPAAAHQTGNYEEQPTWASANGARKKKIWPLWTGAQNPPPPFSPFSPIFGVLW